EAAFARLHRLAAAAPFVVKLAEAQAYRRFVISAESAAAPGDPAAARARIRAVLARPRGVRGGVGMAPEAVNAGKGFMFIDHRGEICPSGFLPLSAGNVRRDAPAEVYRGAPLFLELRDPDRLRGRCGRCEFRRVCGGSRARAWALTGDHLGSDPWCAYEPRPGAAVY
ncbi:MAG: radical SAM/SPASM domain-containing protein, partial [Elusimicrobiota bacterium]